MKKVFVFISIVLFACLALINPAHAETNFSFEKAYSWLPVISLIDGIDIYPVENKFSTSLYDTFEWNEKPWVFIQLPDNYLIDISGTAWEDPINDGSSNNHIANLEYWQIDGNNKQLWFSFTDNNWFGTDSTQGIREKGEWDILSASLAFRTPAGSGINAALIKGSTSLSVVSPEPISTTLFLLGSGVLGAHMLRKKKKTA